MMSPNQTTIDQMTPLLEALCEERITLEEAKRLEQLVLQSNEARWYYVAYVDLHGSLYWDAAGVGSAEALSSDEVPCHPVFADTEVQEPAPMLGLRRNRATQWISRQIVWGTTAACLCIVALFAWSHLSPPGSVEVVEHTQPDSSDQNSQPQPVPQPHRSYGPPIEIAVNLNNPPLDPVVDNQSNDSTASIPAPPAPQHEDLDSREVVATINSEIRKGWHESGIHPSGEADDAEWLRRVSLDLCGRIPTVDEAEAFLSSKRPNKRTELVDKMLDDTAYARNLTTIWTNLLIGRRSDQKVNRSALQKFLRMAFAANRPWNQIAYDLIAAEGNSNDNGATNFLIAHLNNDALPATAVTSRVFLCEQIQCNQCHNNPFNKTTQTAYWELHSFFSQTASVPRNVIDPKTGRVQYAYTELVTKSAGGPAYFETQNGIMRVAYPRFSNRSVDPSPETNRRAMLGRLMTEGEQPKLAAAYVNRLWGHFFGQSFTQVVDDLGPHNPASHPELLDLLTRQFIRSGYDTKQLIRWICNSEPYRLTSRFGTDNHDDDPVEGGTPLFSRMYVKSMTPEQMYDSFVIATRAHRAGGVDWEHAEGQRQQWLSQFVVDYATDENDEAMEFDGNLVQALTLMNGPLVEKALEASAGTLLGEVVRRRAPEREKIRELCLAVLSRPPSAAELTNMSKLVRQDANTIAAHGADRTTAETEGYQDLFWALLNSNEFASVH